MSREQTYVTLPGLLTVNQAVDVADVSYDRSVRTVKIAAPTAPVLAFTLGLKLDGTDTGHRFTFTPALVPVVNRLQAFEITSGLAVPAGQVLTVWCVTPDIGADPRVENVAVWLEAEAEPQAGTDENWVVLTTADLMLADAVYAALVGLFAIDPVPRILASITAEIRSLASRRSKLGPAGTIPCSLRHDAGTLSKARLIQTAPGITGLLGDISKSVEESNFRLRMLAKGEWPVEPPAAPLPAEDQPVPGSAWGSEARIDL